MQKTLWIKCLTIAMIALVLGILLIIISGKITERNHYLDEAKHRIAQSWTGPQQISGPLVIIPYSIRIHDKLTKRTRTVSKTALILPDKVSIATDMSMNYLHKGIYKYLSIPPPYKSETPSTPPK